MPSEQPASTARGRGGGKRRRPALRLVRLAVTAFTSLLALYVIAINVFLSTPLFGKVINATPDTIDIHFEHGWSIVPGHIHARKLSIRGRDSNVEWILRLDEVEFRVSFSSLLKQRFAASHVHGTGISFRLRQRLDAPPKSPEEVATLPPIEGLAPYAIRPQEPPWPGRWNDAEYHLWTAHLEDVVAKDVREIWIDHARFEGSARVDGRFYFKPVRAVDVGPARVSVARGGVYVGERALAEALDGSVLTATLGSFDPRTASGADMIHRVSLDCDARVDLPDVGGLPLGAPEGLTIRGEAALRRAVLHVSSGILQNDSHLEARVTDAVVTSPTHRVTGGLVLVAEVAPAPADGHGRLTFRADMANVEVSHARSARSAMSAFLRAPQVAATGDSGALDLTRPLEDLHFVLEMPEGHLPVARALSLYVPPKADVSIVGGHATAKARFEAWLAERRAKGRGALHAEDLDVRMAKMLARGRMSLEGEFASYDFDTHRLHGASLVIEAPHGSLASSSAPDTPLVRMSDARLAARSEVVDLSDPLRTLDVVISMPTADVASRGLLHAYLPKGSAMQIASSHSRFSLNLNLAIARHLARGSFDLRFKELMLAYRDLRLDTGIRARALVHDWHWETGNLALDGAKVEVTDLTVSKTGSRERAGAPAMSIARIAVAAKSSRFALDDPLAGVTFSASLVDAKVHDSAAINAFRPEKATYELEADEGSFGAQLDVDVENHTARGTVRARATGIGAGEGNLHLRGDVDLLLAFVEWNFEKNTMRLLDSHVVMTRVAGRFRAQGPRELSAERVALSGRSSTFDLARPTLKSADFHLALERGELPDARALAPLMPNDGVVRIESGTAHVAADVTLSASRRAAAGGIDIALMSGAVRLNETRLSGNFLLRARLDGFDPDRDLLDLSGSRLELRDVAVTGASATTSHWGADVALPRASLQLGKAALFDGAITLDARDARPLLALIFGNRLPNIVVRLTDMPRLVASARLVATPYRLAVLDLDARGGDVALRGSYAERRSRRRGAVIARKAFISVGLRVDSGGTRLRFFGLEGWLRDQNREVRKVLESP